jgi:hypothetical protein
MVLIVFFHMALAGPLRCTATFSGPVDGCKVLGTVSVDGTGATDAKASRSAQRALVAVLTARAAEGIAKNPNLSEEDFESCTGTENWSISCREDPSLDVRGICFARFEDDLCWQGDVLNWEGAGPPALDRGRKMLCAEVDEYLDALDYRNESALRAQCRADCLQHSIVSCIDD